MLPKILPVLRTSVYEGFISLNNQFGLGSGGVRLRGKAHGFRGLAIAAFLLFTTAGWSQQPTQSVWQGVLRNPAGAPIPAAKIRLASNAAAETITAADGHFLLPALPAGQ